MSRYTGKEYSTYFYPRTMISFKRAVYYTRKLWWKERGCYLNFQPAWFSFSGSVSDYIKLFGPSFFNSPSQGKNSNRDGQPCFPQILKIVLSYVISDRLVEALSIIKIESSRTSKRCFLPKIPNNCQVLTNALCLAFSNCDTVKLRS